MQHGMYTVTESNQRARGVLCRRRADAVQRSPSIIKHHQRHLSASVRYVAMQTFQTRPPRPNEVAVVTTIAVIVSLSLLSCFSLRFSDVFSVPASRWMFVVFIFVVVFFLFWKRLEVALSCLSKHIPIFVLLRLLRLSSSSTSNIECQASKRPASPILSLLARLLARPSSLAGSAMVP